MKADEAAAIVVGEMREWLGMDEESTKEAIARAVADTPGEWNSVDALRAMAKTAYREVMLKQAMQLTATAAEVERQGWSGFLDRASAALAAMKR